MKTFTKRDELRNYLISQLTLPTVTDILINQKPVKLTHIKDRINELNFEHQIEFVAYTEYTLSFFIINFVNNEWLCDISVYFKEPI